MHRFLGGIFLSVALVSPVVFPVAMKAEHHIKRYYDRDARDWHEWNEAEERAYRRYWEDRREAHRNWERLRREEQRNYWRWRHGHPDTILYSR
jgi:hypothetical protein